MFDGIEWDRVLDDPEPKASRMNVSRETLDLANIRWVWQDYPIGFPIEPDDHDFEGPRTPPMIGLGLEFKHRGKLYHHAAERYGFTKANLPALEIKQMKGLLIDWLIQEINEDAKSN